MNYRITVTALGPRGDVRGSDRYQLTEEDLDKPAWALGGLIRVMALRAAMGKSAWPLPSDHEHEA